jgi:hypothetical protein
VLDETDSPKKMPELKKSLYSNSNL